MLHRIQHLHGEIQEGIAKVVVLAANVALIAIRAPHGHRSRAVKTAKSYKGRLESALLALAWIGFLAPGSR